MLLLYALAAVVTADSTKDAGAETHWPAPLPSPHTVECSRFQYVVEDGLSTAAGEEDEEFSYGLCEQSDGSSFYLSHLPHIYRPGASLTLEVLDDDEFNVGDFERQGHKRVPQYRKDSKRVFAVLSAASLGPLGGPAPLLTLPGRGEAAASSPASPASSGDHDRRLTTQTACACNAYVLHTTDPANDDAYFFNQEVRPSPRRLQPVPRRPCPLPTALIAVYGARCTV